MAPPTEGFFAEAFQPYSSMMNGPSNAPRQFYPSAPMFQTSMPPLEVYPPPGLDFDFNYGMVQHTPPGSLFSIGPSGSGARDDNEDEDDAEADEEEDDAEAVRRNSRRNRRTPRCGT
ncbi:hypothetical protein V6N13_082613 [Hibiscus sabdariffa]